MIAIRIGFADPQFADHAAVGQRLVHVKFSSCRIRSDRPPANRPATTYMMQCSKKSVRKVPETLFCKNACLTKGLLHFCAQKNGNECVSDLQREPFLIRCRNVAAGILSQPS